MLLQAGHKISQTKGTIVSFRPTSQADRNKYTGPLTPTTQRDWIDRIGDTLID